MPMDNGKPQCSPGRNTRIFSSFKIVALKCLIEEWWASFLLHTTAPTARAQVALQIGEELRRIDEYIGIENMSDVHGGLQMKCDGYHRSIQVNR
jgi:hypothetical protein